MQFCLERECIRFTLSRGGGLFSSWGILFPYGQVSLGSLRLFIDRSCCIGIVPGRRTSVDSLVLFCILRGFHCLLTLCALAIVVCVNHGIGRSRDFDAPLSLV